MTKTLRQIWAVARIEFRFGLRRGWPVVGIIAPVLILTVGTLYLASLNMEGGPRDYALDAGASALAMSWVAFQYVALIVLTIVNAPVIPSDRQFGVNELLRSTPLTGAAYLTGKVFGVTAVVLVVGAIALALHLVLHVALIGPVNAGLYAELTLLDGLPMALWATWVGILIAAGLSTRRAAILLGILVGIFTPVVWALVLRPLPSLPSVPYSALLNGQVFSDYVFQRYGLSMGWLTPVSSGVVAQAFLVLALCAAIAAISARLWLRWKENF